MTSQKKIQPTRGRVLVKREAEMELSQGGILIPDSAKEKPAEGIVIAVGEGKFENGSIRPIEVREGQRIYFSKYGGSEITINQEELLIINEDEILAKEN